MKKIIPVTLAISALIAGFAFILDKLYKKALSGMMK